MKVQSKADTKNKIVSIDELESEAAAESNEILESFKQRAANENERLLDATDSEFWVAVCFQTREQKDEFLRKSGLQKIGDKYLDGIKVAKQMGIALDTPVPPERRIQKFGGGYTKRIIGK